MEEEKKKRKNKKKKNKQTKGIENNAIGAEESASSNQNHPAEIRGSEAHTDDTSGIDNDSNRHDTEGAKVSSLAENEKHCRMDTEATFEEKIKQLQKDKVSHMQNEAIFEEKLKQFSREKDVSLLKESNFNERIKQLQNENNSHLLKEASFEMKIMQLQDEISSLRRQEANQEEKIRQLHMEKDVYLQKEAEFQMKNSQLQSEKNSWLLKEAGLEKRNNELVDEVEKLNSKRVNLEKKVKEMEKETENREVSSEERISLLVDEVENSNSTRVSLEEKVKETEKERENWVQKEKSFREIISSLNGDNALLETQVKQFEELRTNMLQENQLLKANIQVLQTQVYNLENSAGPPCLPTGHEMNTPENGDLNSEVVATQALVDKLIDENVELVEKVKNLSVELERRGPPMAISSYLGSDVITTSSEAAHIANESPLGSHKMSGAVHEHEVDHTTEPKSQPSEAVLQSSERLQSLKDTIDKAVSDDEHIPLDENEVQSADLEVTSVDQDQYEEEVPLTNAPLIGAPFRLISFFARYVSGADLVNKNSATSNQ
ncbi:hypothetical protein RDI58_022183 [Solanum bulbocastanum]|uniref:Uncharacterized protein n=1 Tax=Solanum bulbocastanum TaxID=147425 RepID=A0AAN8T274_SOLBU